MALDPERQMQAIIDRLDAKLEQQDGGIADAELAAYKAGNEVEAALTQATEAQTAVQALAERVEALEVASGRDILPTISDQAFTARETAAVGTAVGTIIATRAAVIEIIDGDGGAFEVNPASGVIRTVGALDYANRPGYALTVRASNAFGEATAAVNIVVLEVPDVVDEGEEPPAPTPPPVVVDGTPYVVGPGQVYATLAGLPWNEMADGALVKILHKATPYREKFILYRPITLEGVPGPNGERPILDGRDAVTANTGQNHVAHEERGLVTISKHRQADWPHRPLHITVRGIHLRGAKRGETFTDERGSARKFRKNAAGWYVERGGVLTLDNVIIESCSNGAFAASGDSDGSLVNDILVKDCIFRGNGNQGSDREHNSYIESLRIIYQDCSWEDAVGSGEHLKDRSTGVQIIRPTFRGRGSRIFGLVEPENGRRMLEVGTDWGTVDIVNAVVYRPVDGAGSIVHFGGDFGDADRSKKLLRIDGMTVHCETDRSRSWRVIFVKCQDETQRIKAKGVTIHRTLAPGATKHSHLSMLETFGEIEFYGGDDASHITDVNPSWTHHRSGVTPHASSQVIGAELIGAV